MMRAKRCIYDGGKEHCQKHRMYAFPGDRAKFCSLHKLPGMIDVHNKRCEANGCDKHPTYGTANGRARFCAKHKDPEMVDVHGRPCEYPMCNKHPHYAFEGDRARFCASHKEEGMVDVKHKRCHTAGCREPRTYETPTKKSRFCASHLEEWLFTRGNFSGKNGKKVDQSNRRGFDGGGGGGGGGAAPAAGASLGEKPAARPSDGKRPKMGAVHSLVSPDGDGDGDEDDDTVHRSNGGSFTDSAGAEIGWRAWNGARAGDAGRVEGLRGPSATATATARSLGDRNRGPAPAPYAAVKVEEVQARSYQIAEDDQAYEPGHPAASMSSVYSRCVRRVPQRAEREGSSQGVSGGSEQRPRHSCNVPLLRPRARSEDVGGSGAPSFHTASASSRDSRSVGDECQDEDDDDYRGYPEYAETNRWGFRVDREARSDWEQGEAIPRRADYFGVGPLLTRSGSVPCRRGATQRVRYPVEIDDRGTDVSGQGRGLEVCSGSAKHRRVDNGVVFGGCCERQRGAVLDSCPEEMEFDHEEAVSNQTALSRDGEGYEGKFGFGEYGLAACPEEVHRVDARNAGTSGGVVDGDSGDAEAASDHHPVFSSGGKWGGRGAMGRRDVFRLSASWGQRLDAGFEDGRDLGDSMDGRGNLVTPQRWGIEGCYQDPPQNYPVHFGNGELGGAFMPAVFHDPVPTESTMPRSHRREASWDPNCQSFFAPHGFVRRGGGGSEAGVGVYGDAGGAGGVQGPWGVAVDGTRFPMRSFDSEPPRGVEPRNGGVGMKREPVLPARGNYRHGNGVRGGSTGHD